MARHTLGRRRLLQLGGATTLVALAGCTEERDADDEGGTSGSGTESVTVGPDGEFAFDPAELAVDAGTTVTFSWESGGHDIAVDSQPEDGDWGGVTETQESGYEHEHTFDAEGSYEYVCRPHEGSGMVGTITVGDADPEAEDSDGDGSDDSDGGDNGGPVGY